MTVSIVIPTLNDNSSLTELLTLIRSWNQRPFEIIVVDALNDEKCEAICHSYNAKWLSFKKNRGAQQKFGAQHSSGETLWFLHADAQPQHDAIEFIEQSIQQGSNGGFFRFEFATEDSSFTQSILTAFTNWRSRHFIAYGDQGIFVRKSFYEECGGHQDQALFEEVQLIKSLRKSRKLHISTIPIKVSTRRWEKDGYWTRTLHNRFLAMAFILGVSVEKLSQWYTPKKVQLPD